ncbi:glycosyltransferase [Candidatus Kaiserbacteria bacterium]|nr:glycosyltransferase [Candidatus Kaiserbacteria bacterium]
MKKILFVITKSNWGGAQRYVFDLATHLSHEQFDIAVALGGIGGVGACAGLLESRLHEAGVRTTFLKSFARDADIAREISAFFELLRIIHSEKPDVLHLNSSKAGGLGALAGRIAGVQKIIFTAHGWPFAEKRNAMWRLFALLGSWATALFSHVVIVVSKNDFRLGKQLPFCKNKMHMIYNGIDPQMRFGSGEKIRNAFPVGVRITGTIGELNKNKNQQVLIEQAKNDSDMHVAIVGEGEAHTMLETKIKKYNVGSRVKLFGFMPASEVLKGFDVFALPSLKEGLPYVLLEARTAGLPIVANRVGGVSEILDAKDMSDFSLERMVQKTIALY